MWFNTEKDSKQEEVSKEEEKKSTKNSPKKKENKSKDAKEKYGEIVEKLKYAIKKQKENHRLYYQLGRYLAKLAGVENDTEKKAACYYEAFNSFNKAIELKDDYAKAYKARAILLMIIGGTDKEAIKSAREDFFCAEAFSSLPILQNRPRSLSLESIFYNPEEEIEEIITRRHSI